VRTVNENLARALGIAGCVFDTARWPAAVNTQATCAVWHVAKVLDWLMGNYHDSNGLTVDNCVSLMADVVSKLVPHGRLGGPVAVCMGNTIGPGETGRRCMVISRGASRLNLLPHRSAMWQRRGLQCNVTTKSRGRSRLWPNGLQKNEEAGYGQADCRSRSRQWPSNRTAEKPLEILLSQAHTHHVVVLSSCHIALL